MHNNYCLPQSINDLESTFNQKRAEHEAQAYLYKGANKRVQKLLSYFQEHSSKPFTVLDIGCGVGATHFELLKNGLALNVVGVDASTTYLESAKQVADILRFVDRVRYLRQDFAQSHRLIESADVVILDRVICCYPHLEELLVPAAKRARRYLALSYPHEDWWVRSFYEL